MFLATLAVVLGLVLLVWSADRFVEGAASTADNLGMPPLLIGLVVVGFGTSAPEIVVSAAAALQGNPGIALGNAYGSNISNIALILGFTALLSPIAFKASVLRIELPILTAVTAVCAWQLVDGKLSRLDGVILLTLFGALLLLAIWFGMRKRGVAPAVIAGADIGSKKLSTPLALLWLLFGLILLVLSSRLLVWGAIIIARNFGVSDLVIGLTIIAVGTSLPELASSIAAIRKGEHDMAVGNVIGSNLLNTLVVVGIAAVIKPMQVEAGVLSRDVVVMGALTLSLFVFGFRFRTHNRINRFEGGLLLASYIAYTTYLISTTFAAG